VRRFIVVSAATRSAIIVGLNTLGKTLGARLKDHPYLSVKVAGFFDDRSPERIGEFGAFLGNLADVPEYVRQHRINCVYISLPMAAQPRIVRLMQELRDTTASVYFLPDFFAFDLLQARFDTVGGIPIATICETPHCGVDAVLKRTMDIALAISLIAASLPLMAVIALALKLESAGPVLFRQRRYGMDGREIVVLKFRTMTVCEDGPQVKQAQRNDSRITRLGSILRRASLDELPQFFNVLGGSMSIVGPRPHAVAHNEAYRKLISGYMLRHKVKPGITGWAQINGLRGETDTVEKMRRRVDLDLEYLNNWSASLDLWIVVKTAASIWRHREAY